MSFVGVVLSSPPSVLSDSIFSVDSPVFAVSLVGVSFVSSAPVSALFGIFGLTSARFVNVEPVATLRNLGPKFLPA